MVLQLVPVILLNVVYCHIKYLHMDNDFRYWKLFLISTKSSSVVSLYMLSACGELDKISINT